MTSLKLLHLDAPKAIIQTVLASLNSIGVNATGINLDNHLQTSLTRLAANQTLIFLADPNQVKSQQALLLLNSHASFIILGVFFKAPTKTALPLLDHCLDYLYWPAPADELAVRLSRVNSRKKQIQTRQLAPSKLTSLNLVGKAPLFLHALRLIEKVAHCDVHVLIEGETGTGKELAAQAIHQLSARKHKPFVAINCGTLKDGLLENELFGHEKGAYTDARNSQKA